MFSDQVYFCLNDYFNKQKARMHIKKHYYIRKKLADTPFPVRRIIGPYFSEKYVTYKVCSREMLNVYFFPIPIVMCNEWIIWNDIRDIPTQIVINDNDKLGWLNAILFSWNYVHTKIIISWPLELK